MRTHSLVAATLGVLAACSAPGVAVQAGYARLGLDGDIGYAQAGSGVAIAQDIESGFGLGDDQGSPYGRAMLDLGTPVFAVSGFLFEEEGTGQLQADFGDITASTAVRTDFKMANAKGSFALEIPIGPVSISPGIAVDYFDLDIEVQDTFGAINESVEVAGPVPMGFLRAEASLWSLGAIVEVGYMKVDIEDVDASLLDAEALVEYRPTPLLHVFAGYRLLDLSIEGLVDDDSFDADITLSGFFVGGGLRF